MTRLTMVVAAGIVLGAALMRPGTTKSTRRSGAGGAGHRRETGRQEGEGDDGQGDAGAGRGQRQHRHPGPAFGYVLEGVYEWAIDDNPTKVLKVGGHLLRADRLPPHRVSRNPSKVKTRVLAWVLCGTRGRAMPGVPESGGARDRWRFSARCERRRCFLRSGTVGNVRESRNRVLYRR